MNGLRHAALLCLALPVSASALEKIGPTWSEVTGLQYSRAKMNRLPAVVKSIDGDDTLYRIVKVVPGQHVIRLSSSMRKGITSSDQEIKLDVLPCKRYYLNAQFASSVGGDWTPVVDYVEPLTGCKAGGAPK
jgi:hypothetical protein